MSDTHEHEHENDSEEPGVRRLGQVTIRESGPLAGVWVQSGGEATIGICRQPGSDMAYVCFYDHKIEDADPRGPLLALAVGEGCDDDVLIQLIDPKSGKIKHVGLSQVVKLAERADEIIKFVDRLSAKVEGLLGKSLGEILSALAEKVEGKKPEYTCAPVGIPRNIDGKVQVRTYLPYAARQFAGADEGAIHELKLDVSELEAYTDAGGDFLADPAELLAAGIRIVPLDLQLVRTSPGSGADAGGKPMTLIENEYVDQYGHARRFLGNGKIELSAECHAAVDAAAAHAAARKKCQPDCCKGAEEPRCQAECKQEGGEG